MALNPLIAFQDGEALVPADFELISTLLRRRVIGDIGRFNVRAAVSDVRNASNGDFIGQGNYVDTPTETAGHLFVPFAGQPFEAPETKAFYNWALRLGFRQSNYFQMLDLEEDFGSWPSLAATAAVNPRWDTLELAIATADGTPESRDVEDAATRAVTSQNINKRIVTSLTTAAWVAGAEAALPDFPALTAGRFRLISVKREVAEGGTIAKANFAYHVYPMRLLVEDVYGRDAFYNPAKWDVNDGGSVVRSNNSTGDDLIFHPRRMHQGCRLLAVGMSQSMTTEPEAILQRRSIDTSGVISYTDLAQIGAGGLIQGSGGLRYAGEKDWSEDAGAGISSGTNAPFPIWGNGHSYGPMFTSDDAIASPVASSHLVLRLTDSGPAWDASTDIVHFVRFIYAC